MANGSNTEFPEIQLIPPEQYKPIAQKAKDKLAGHPSVTPDTFKVLAEALGLDQELELEWKPNLRLVT